MVRSSCLLGVSEQIRYWEAAILLPTSQQPITLNGEATCKLMVKQVEATYGENAERFSEEQFLLGIQRRTVHTPEMFAVKRD